MCCQPIQLRIRQLKKSCLPTQNHAAQDRNSLLLSTGYLFCEEQIHEWLQHTAVSDCQVQGKWWNANCSRISISWKLIRAEISHCLWTIASNFEGFMKNDSDSFDFSHLLSSINKRAISHILWDTYVVFFNPTFESKAAPKVRITLSVLTVSIMVSCYTILNILDIIGPSVSLRDNGFTSNNTLSPLSILGWLAL